MVHPLRRHITLLINNISCAYETVGLLPQSSIAPPGIYSLQVQRYCAEAYTDLKPDCDLHNSNALDVLCHENNTRLTQYYSACQSQEGVLSCPKTLTKSLYENSFQMFQLSLFRIQLPLTQTEVDRGKRKAGLVKETHPPLTKIFFVLFWEE